MKLLIRCAMTLLASLLLLAACRPVQSPAQALPGTNWLLSSLEGQMPLPGANITLQFGVDGTASGSDGCNRYSTSYTVNQSSISFGQPAATTMMACAEPVMRQAETYLQALGRANRFQLQNDLLILLDGQAVLATFVAEAQGLAGTSWQVTAYNNGAGAVVSTILGSEISAVFDENGQIVGNGGCNDYFASYLATEGDISIGPVGATRQVCSSPPGVMEQESAYLAALGSAATYRVENSQLEMRDKAGAIAVQMARRLHVSLAPPEPTVPTAQVTAPGGVNVRSGPGTNYPVLGVAPCGAKGEVVGRSADGLWWAVSAPAVPGGLGWVSADFVAVTNAEDVSVIVVAPPVYVPPVVTPAPPPTPVPPPTATPAAQISFWADQTTIEQGQCTNLNWSVHNVQAVWVYPQGQPYQQYPQIGEGSQQVCPPVTTTYEMLVLERNGATTVRQVTINVIPAAPANPLAGTSWLVTGYNNGAGAMVTAISGTSLTAAFESSQISGSAGCNQYFGEYWVSGNSIAFGMLGMGQMMCADPIGIMEQEQQFLTALQSAASYRLEGNRLELYRADGILTVTLTR